MAQARIRESGTYDCIMAPEGHQTGNRFRLLASQPQPTPFPLLLAVLVRLSRQPSALPLLLPRLPPLDLLRLPLHPVLPSGADRYCLARLGEVPRQLVQAVPVLAPDTGQLHAPAAGCGP